MALEVASERFHIVLFLADIPVSQADMVEYNQCQSSLKGLYELGIPGNVEEFTAYRILLLLHGRNRSGWWLSLAPSHTLRSLTVHRSSRIKSIRESADVRTESISGGEACVGRATCPCYRKLSWLL